MIRTYLQKVAGFSPASRAFLIALFFQFTGQTTLWVLRNLYLKKAGFDEEFIGTALAASSAGAALSILLLAREMDRRRLKGFMLADSLLISIGLAGVALIPEPVPILILSVVTGLGMGISQMCMPLFFVRHSSDEERAYLFGVGQALHPLAGLAMTLGIKGGALAWGETLEATRHMMLIGSAMPLAAFFALLRIRESPPEPPAPAEAPEPPLDWNLGLKFAATELAIGIGSGLTIPFINLYFYNRFSVEPGDVSLFYAAAEAIMFVGFLSTPLFAIRYGAVRTIVLFQIGSIPFFLLMAFTTSLPLAVAAFLARQAMMNMVQPVSDHFLMEAADPRQRARINGLKQMCRRGSWVIAPAASGYLIARAGFVVDGFTTVMLITIGLYLASAAMYWGFFRSHRTVRAPARESEPSVRL
jgi:MFS family permease